MNIKLNVLLAAVLGLAFLGLGLGTGMAQASSEQKEGVTIALVGDSTVATFPATSTKKGWGEEIPRFFSPTIRFVNVALGGASTKSFPEDKWKAVLKPGTAFVLIQFGHNDSHAPDRPESTDAQTGYKENLRRYVTQAREAGVAPILVTPVHRRMFDAAGHVTQELAAYAKAMREVAQELKVPVIDLNEKSGALFEALGDAGSSEFTVNATDQQDRPNQQDRTHFTQKGAHEMARLVAEGLVEIDPRLKAAAAAAAVKAE